MGEAHSRLSSSVKYHPVQSRRKVGRVLKQPLVVDRDTGCEYHSEGHVVQHQNRGGTRNQQKLDFLQPQTSGNQSNQSAEGEGTSDGRELNPLTRSIHEDFKISRFVLGIGVTGKVVECIEKRTNQKCALKVLKNIPKGRDEANLHWLASACPHVVNILEIYENEVHGQRCLLLVMEFMEGGELFTRIKSRGPNSFTEREAAGIMYDVCSAVEYIHRIGIAHRDIKPENLLYTCHGPKGVIKLTDFGFAKRLNADEPKSLRTPCFTPYYVPPEILANQTYDKSCDVWSLGVVMYILLCGFPPFASFHGLPMSPGMKHRIRTGQYKFPSPMWDPISNEAKQLIQIMLKVQPDERPSISDVLKHAWLEDRRSIPETKLSTPMILSDQCQLDTINNEFSNALEELRLNCLETKLKPLDQTSSLLLKRRLKKMQPDSVSIN